MYQRFEFQPFSHHPTKHIGVVVTLCTCFYQIPNLNLNQAANYSNWSFYNFSHFHQANAGFVSPSNPQLPPKSLPDHHVIMVISLLFDIT